jgi:hypothetical protein
MRKRICVRLELGHERVDPGAPSPIGTAVGVRTGCAPAASCSINPSVPLLI